MPVVYVQAGDHINYTPGSDLPCGSIVVQNGLVGISTRPIVADELGSLAVVGVFRFFKTDDDTFDVGASAYLDVGAGEITSEPSGNLFIGKAWKEAAADDETVDVRLSPDCVDSGEGEGS